jgi:cytochrome c peroxidase
LYTDLQVHDVGTADAPGEWFGPLIDTPTLRFLYDSAPYLHDGSAATLHDVLVTANQHDEHGVTSHLTQEQIEDLVAFMLVLPFTD